jgi:ABC-type multidrug transport system fused ATPase/permease subunit
VISRQQRALLQRAAGIPSLAVASVLGCITALTVPLVFLLCGVVVDILATPDQPSGDRYGLFLPNLRRLLPADVSPLGQVSIILLIALAIVALQVVCLYAFYRRIQVVAVGFEASIMEQLRDHSRKLAVSRTLSGQQTALVDGLEYHLPRVRASFSRWWRASPRHFVQLAASLVLALLVSPLLALLSLVAAAIVVMVYRLLDRHRRTTLPVVRERATQRRAQVMALCLQGPLLESVHAEDEIRGSFREELAAYRKEAVRSLVSSAWKTPLVVGLTGVLGCLFVFLVSIQVLRPDRTLTLAGCLTFLLSCVGVAISAIRLQRSARELRSVQTASEDLLRFLGLPAERLPVLEPKKLSRVTQRVELEHVTVQDSSGRKLLQNVTAQFEPNKLIGVVASQRLQASALMELLLGIGRPVSGRMLVDSTLVSDIEPEMMKRLGIWVSEGGPLVTGTVDDNLFGGRKTQNASGVLDALRAARSLEAVQRLPEGTATIITPSDDRFLPDTPFRLGIARAILRQPSIVVLEEPATRVDSKTEQETIEAIRALVKPDCITVLLPQRLTTLRQCDQIILLHDHRVTDVGTHSELLQRSDLYRHLNYVRFSPLRHVTV